MCDARCLVGGAKNSCREDTLRACRIRIYFFLFISMPAPHSFHNVLIMILLHFCPAHVCIPHELFVCVCVCLIFGLFFFLIAAEWLLSVRCKCTALELIGPLLKYVFFLFLYSYCMCVGVCMCMHLCVYIVLCACQCFVHTAVCMCVCVHILFACFHNRFICVYFWFHGNI